MKLRHGPSNFERKRQKLGGMYCRKAAGSFSDKDSSVRGVTAHLTEIMKESSNASFWPHNEGCLSALVLSHTQLKKLMP